MRKLRTKSRACRNTNSYFTLLSRNTEKVKAWSWLINFNYCCILNTLWPAFWLCHICVLWCVVSQCLFPSPVNWAVCRHAAGLHTGVGRRRKLCCLTAAPQLYLEFICKTASLCTCAHLAGGMWRLINCCLRTALWSWDESANEYKRIKLIFRLV